METDKNRDHLRSSRSEWRTPQSMIRKKQRMDADIEEERSEREREKTIEEDEESDI